MIDMERKPDHRPPLHVLRAALWCYEDFGGVTKEEWDECQEYLSKLEIVRNIAPDMLDEIKELDDDLRAVRREIERSRNPGDSAEQSENEGRN